MLMPAIVDKAISASNRNEKKDITSRVKGHFITNNIITVIKYISAARPVAVIVLMGTL